MTKLHKPVGVVLAGGRSSRMGVEKPLMDLAGSTLLHRGLDRLSGSVSTLVLSANGDAARFAEYGLPVIGDTIDGHRGPLAGILAGMMWTIEHKPEASHIVTIASDTPFFPRDLVKALVGALDRSEYRDKTAIAIPQSRKRLHPAFGLWPLAFASDLQDYLSSGQCRVHSWLERHETVCVSFDELQKGEVSLDPFFNINDPDDLKIAMEWVAKTSS